MFSLLHHQLFEMKSLLNRAYDKRASVCSRRNFARALQLFFVTLRKAQNDLESIYFSYILKPQLQAQNSIALSCVYLISEMVKTKGQKAPPSGTPCLPLLCVAEF